MNQDLIYKLWAECVVKHTQTPMNWQTAADEFAKLLIDETYSFLLHQTLDDGPWPSRQESLEYQSEGYKHTREVNYDEFAQQIVGETITAIMCAKLQSITLTSYDADIAQATQMEIVNAVRDHWSFQ